MPRQQEASRKRLADQQIGDEHAGDCRNRRGDACEQQRIAERLEAGREDGRVVVERQRVVDAWKLGERDVDHREVEEQNGADDGVAADGERRDHSAGNADRLGAWLAGHGDVAALAHPIAVNEEGRHGWNQHQARKQRAGLQVEVADHLRIGFDGEGRVIAADQHRIAEILHRLDEDEKDGAEDGRRDEW
jgi:hypothetical protein